MTHVTTLIIFAFLACTYFTASAFTVPSRPLAFTASGSSARQSTLIYMGDKGVIDTDEHTQEETTTMPATSVFVPPEKSHTEAEYGVSPAKTEEGEKEMSDTQKMMQKVKDSGLAGVISYALWELGFWTLSVPVCIVGYQKVTGHWPDLQNSDDLQKLGAEAFAFVNFARFAVPLRIGLALSTTPWIQENIVDRFNIDDKNKEKADNEQ